MFFIRRGLALALVGAGALSLLGCQEDNEKSVRAQANLSPPPDSKGVPASQPGSLDDRAKQYQQKGGSTSTYGGNYPGISKVKSAAPKAPQAPNGK